MGYGMGKEGGGQEKRGHPSLDDALFSCGLKDSSLIFSFSLAAASFQSLQLLPPQDPIPRSKTVRGKFGLANHKSWRIR
jgi:hypothetical protein